MADLRINQAKKVVFDNTSYEQAKKQNRLLIRDEDGTVIVDSVLKNPFNYNVNSEWQPLISTDGIFPLAQKGINIITDQSAFAAGAWTRKYYMGGGYLNLNLEFRVVDWGDEFKIKGNITTISPVLIAAILLTNKTTPRLRNPGDNKIAEQIADYVSKQLGNSEISGGIEALKSQITTAAEKDTASGEFIRNFVEGLQRSLKDANYIDSTLSKNPSMISIDVGGYFSMDRLIVEGVDVSFSKELTERGPLYGDFTVRVSSREVLSSGSRNNSAFNSIGLKKRQSRVTIEAKTPRIGADSATV